MSKKWRRIDKKKRNENLAQFAKEHPEYTHKALGGVFHIHPSRVTRILQKYKANDNRMPEIPDN